MPYINKLKTYAPAISCQVPHITLQVNNGMRNKSAISAVFKSCTDAMMYILQMIISGERNRTQTKLESYHCETGANRSPSLCEYPDGMIIDEDTNEF